ncbi:MAG: hypothetical protein J5590_00950 [Clostridia bacterium]|nr:hypothetical protein [Clostridia bacterium]
MKWLGTILWIIGLLGISYIVSEVNIDVTEFTTFPLFILWCGLTMGLGGFLINSGSKHKEEK